MFTGIIHHQGIFKGYRQGKREIAVEAPLQIPSLGAGESVALNGVCLSLTKREENVMFFNLSLETLLKTTLGSLKIGEKLNLELPLTLQSPLSGHLVTGHIDGKGKDPPDNREKTGKKADRFFPARAPALSCPQGLCRREWRQPHHCRAWAVLVRSRAHPCHP